MRVSVLFINFYFHRDFSIWGSHVTGILKELPAPAARSSICPRKNDLFQALQDYFGGAHLCVTLTLTSN
jgi:hypothetical protein